MTRDERRELVARAIWAMNPIADHIGSPPKLFDVVADAAIKATLESLLSGMSWPDPEEDESWNSGYRAALDDISAAISDASCQTSDVRT